MKKIGLIMTLVTVLGGNRRVKTLSVEGYSRKASVQIKFEGI